MGLTRRPDKHVTQTCAPECAKKESAVTVSVSGGHESSGVEETCRNCGVLGDAGGKVSEVRGAYGEGRDRGGV